MEQWDIRDLQRRGAQPRPEAVDRETSIRRALDAVRGTADTDLTTDEIMRMTRGDDSHTPDAG